MLREYVSEKFAQLHIALLSGSFRPIHSVPHRALQLQIVPASPVACQRVVVSNMPILAYLIAFRPAGAEWRGSIWGYCVAGGMGMAGHSVVFLKMCVKRTMGMRSCGASEMVNGFRGHSVGCGMT